LWQSKFAGFDEWTVFTAVSVFVCLFDMHANENVKDWDVDVCYWARRRTSYRRSRLGISRTRYRWKKPRSRSTRATVTRPCFVYTSWSNDSTGACHDRRTHVTLTVAPIFSWGRVYGHVVLSLIVVNIVVVYRKWKFKTIFTIFSITHWVWRPTTKLHCVPKNITTLYHYNSVTYLNRFWDFYNFCAKCYWQSKQSNGTLFPHQI